MLTRQKVVTYGIPTVAAATIAIAAGLTMGHPDTTKPLDTLVPQPVEVGNGHAVDVVFAIDTTGSMGGLIKGAKETVWSIATRVKQIDPQADVRIGLVAYRDIGDDYVTKDFPLSSDLDQVFANLSGLKADGGNDIPEDVDAGLYDAVHKMPWRANAKKMIFVVGDAPPATRGDVPSYEVTAREAAGMQISVNAIRAGWDVSTQTTFSQMAMLGNGEFSTISQDGGVQQVATPYDAKMAELSRAVDATAVIIGDDGVRAGYAQKMEAGSAAPPAAMADRATFYGSKGRDKADIVGTGAAIETIAPSALPADLRGMTKEGLRTELDHRGATRKAAQQEIERLSKQREEYLKTNAKDSDTAFDAKVKKTVEKAMTK